MDRKLRALVHDRLALLSEGRLTMIENGVSATFGGPSDDLSDASIYVHNPRLYRRIVIGGALGAAEAFLDGDWSSDDLTTVLRVFARNLAVPSKMEGGLVKVVGLYERLKHQYRRNSKTGSKKNIAAHYDLGDDFYELFLDETMTYSCGVFAHEAATLREASIEKYDRICRKLELKPDDHVLEIGCGWGGFALHAARNYGCRITATTISDRQFDAATKRVQEAGLSTRVEIVKRDYRDLTGTFSKVVSIEMIEAVGHGFMPDYLKMISDRLATNGMAAIQAITIPDQFYDAYRNSVDFIQKHIFPGGCLVSFGRMTKLLAEKTDLRPIHLESMPEHYARTLAEWRIRFLERIEEAKSLKYDDRFLRAWLYYLCYCEAGFWERSIGVSQIILAKPGARPKAIVPQLQA
jgi:cyclopropane-fatty-acyl-phospholipid synthase